MSYLTRVVRSIALSDAADRLGAITSMHDIVVAREPAEEPPVEVVIVRAPGSLYPPSDGAVRIDYLTANGPNEEHERPERDAVPLFWRLVGEKWGIASDRT
jgi:hypothetical protein